MFTPAHPRERVLRCAFDHSVRSRPPLAVSAGESESAQVRGVVTQPALSERDSVEFERGPIAHAQALALPSSHLDSEPDAQDVRQGRARLRQGALTAAAAVPCCALCAR